MTESMELPATSCQTYISKARTIDEGGKATVHLPKLLKGGSIGDYAGACYRVTKRKY